jgi:tRNA threonylcarbamoyladenosine biosynthesis protein TsaE
MNKNFFSKNSQETKMFAESLAQNLINTRKNKQAIILGLTGDLGSGKTTFTQGLIKGLKIKKRILSPTFVILKRFCPPQSSGLKNVYHIDAYRIKKKDLLDLGWNKILNEHSVVIIEWAERVGSVLPQDTIWINFEHGRTENERKITVN